MTADSLTRRKLLVLAPAGFLTACSSVDGAAIFDTLAGAANPGGLTQAEAAAGIREALTNGIGSAISTVGRDGGYFNDNRIQIPLPPQLAEVQSQLARFGLSGALDDLQRQINRGAEVAAPQARSIFVDAIRALTIQDAIGIVRGGPTSATGYFQRTTTPQLTGLFTPVMENALQRAGAIQTYDRLVGRLSALPLAPQLGADAKQSLITHGVEKGLDGLFYYIGQEEAAIRANPAKRTSAILQRVFG